MTSAVRAVCDSVAAPWRAAPGITLRLVDTSATVMSSDAPVTGCHVNAYTPKALDSALVKRLFWTTAVQRGWKPQYKWSADGPDGGVLTWDRGAVRCEVRNELDGGDDSDTTYVPLPWERETSFCWHNGPAR